jgi:hypothetical protein
MGSGRRELNGGRANGRLRQAGIRKLYSFVSFAGFELKLNEPFSDDGPAVRLVQNTAEQRGSHRQHDADGNDEEQ